MDLYVVGPSRARRSLLGISAVMVGSAGAVLLTAADGVAVLGALALVLALAAGVSTLWSP